MELISVRKEDLEKLSMDFTPEMQEKVRQCKTMEELYAFFAENDVELSEDVLAAKTGKEIFEIFRQYADQED